MALIYRDIEIAIRKVLIEDTTLQGLLGVDPITVLDRIYIGHISNTESPKFPCVTFKISMGGINPDEYTVYSRLHIDVWTKTNIDDAQLIYARIRDLINLKSIPNTTIAQVKEKMYNDDLYEKVTRTNHISVWYAIQAINT